MFDEPIDKVDKEASFPSLTKKSSRRESYIKKNIKCIKRDSIPNYNATLKPRESPSLTAQLGLRVIQKAQLGPHKPVTSP